MFYLRRISGAGIQMNFWLGKNYTLIDKEVSPYEFQIHADHVEEVDEKTYAIVVCDGGSKCHQLYDGQRNYIMTGGGTIANLTKSYKKEVEAHDETVLVETDVPSPYVKFEGKEKIEILQYLIDERLDKKKDELIDVKSDSKDEGKRLAYSIDVAEINDLTEMLEVLNNELKK